MTTQILCIMGPGGGIGAVFDLSHLESRFTGLENMMKGLVLQQSPPSQTHGMCFQYHVLNYTLSICLYFAHHLTSGQQQANMTYQRPKK